MFEDKITSLYLANLLLLVRKIFCVQLHFSMPRLVTSFFWMLLEGWECSCIFLMHAVMCNRVNEHCSMFADV